MEIQFMNQLLDYKKFYSPSAVFVETGTAAGDGVQRALDAGFVEVHSIEAARSWYDLCIERFQNDERVFLHLGRSKDVLEDLRTVLPKTNLVFFLDAHPSGPLSAGHDDLMAHGSQSPFSQDNIIKTELNIIFECYEHPTIIIDDMNGEDFYSRSYMTMILLYSKFYRFRFYDENLNGDHFYKNKILVAVPGEK